MNIKSIIRAIFEAFVTVETVERVEWEWESDAERDAFRRYFHFCN